VIDNYETTLVQLAASLRVGHVAHWPLTTIAARAPLAQAQAIARSQTLNNLPVVDEADGIVGVLENVNREIADYAVPRDDARAA
jgi:hypothetical protein